MLTRPFVEAKKRNIGRLRGRNIPIVNQIHRKRKRIDPPPKFKKKQGITGGIDIFSPFNWGRKKIKHAKKLNCQSPSFNSSEIRRKKSDRFQKPVRFVYNHYYPSFNLEGHKDLIIAPFFSNARIRNRCYYQNCR